MAKAKKSTIKKSTDQELRSILYEVHALTNVIVGLKLTDNLAHAMELLQDRFNLSKFSKQQQETFRNIVLDSFSL